MRFILILTADPERRPLSDEIVNDIRTRLRMRAEAVWLHHGCACELPLPYDSGFDALMARGHARTLLADLPVDVNAVAAETRRKRLLVADMDSTVIEQECIDELAAMAGVGEKVRAITERAMRGEIDFVPALRERVALLEGLPAEAIETVISERIVLRPGGRALVQTMRANGAFTALISGGFSQFTAHVAERTGFEFHQANELLVRDGVLVGKVAEPTLGKDAKVETLERLCRERDLSPRDVIAVGDGANDIPMLARAGLGVAFHAKPAVRDAASFSIDHGDLTALLYLQGYRREEFIV